MYQFTLYASFRGGTGSDAVILNQRGEIVVKSVGPATNPWVGTELSQQECLH